MKVISWSHKDLYDEDGIYFIDDLPFIERRIEKLSSNFQRIVHFTTPPTEPEAYSKHQQRVNAINKAIEHWCALKEDILKDSFIKN